MRTCVFGEEIVLVGGLLCRLRAERREEREGGRRERAGVEGSEAGVSLKCPSTARLVQNTPRKAIGMPKIETAPVT